eukprot:s6747_g2.t1
MRQAADDGSGRFQKPPKLWYGLERCLHLKGTNNLHLAHISRGADRAGDRASTDTPRRNGRSKQSAAALKRKSVLFPASEIASARLTAHAQPCPERPILLSSARCVPTTSKADQASDGWDVEAPKRHGWSPHRREPATQRRLPPPFFEDGRSTKLAVGDEASTKQPRSCDSMESLRHPQHLDSLNRRRRDLA